RNIVQTEGMTPGEKETSIRHNIAAFLVNRFLTKLIEGKISDTVVSAKTLKSFILDHAEEVSCQFSVIPAESNEMILSLTPAQFFAINQTILSEGFEATQNEILDSLTPENKPFFYFGNLYDEDFQTLWVRNIVRTKEMTESEKENAIRHNMAAYLVNMFMMHLIEGKISKTVVSAESLKAFLLEQNNN
ncbi:MAG: hypothetical protein WCJ95_22655, partial [Mariniphaga sp.]